MRIRPTVALAFVLVACSQAQPAAAVPSGVATNHAPASSAALTSPTPSLAPGDLPVSSVDFSCSLPVVTRGNDGSGVTLQGGFISFPSGRLTHDPNGIMQSRYPQNDTATTATPILYGTGGAFYDLAAKQWVPALPPQSTADGSAYAYVTPASLANVVNVASGGVRIFDLHSLDRPAVEDFGARGVYLVSPSALGGPGEGVWLLDPGNGSVTQLRAVHRVWAVRDGKAWVARLDPRDKTAWPAMEIAPADSVAQLDLATGTETEWFYRAGAYPWMIGLSSGRPVISVVGSGGQGEIRLLDKPGSDGELIYSGSLVFDGYMGNIQGDGERTWIASAHGIYLYRPSHGFQKVFAFEGDPYTATQIQPAGFCL